MRRSLLACLPLVTAGAAVLALVASACGSSGDPAAGDGSGSSSSSTSSSGSSGDPGSSSGVLPGTSGGLPPDQLTGCAQDTIQATEQPLDVLVLFDTSDSMNDQVAQGVSKYKAISDAVSQFLGDKRSDGIGAGLTFFPVPKAGTPTSCTAGSCPSGSGPCSANACDQFGPLYFCDTKNECANGKQCAARGRCQNGPNTYCSNIGTACPKDANGFDLGMCVAQTAAWCTKADSCVATDYGTPVLPIAPLPGSAAGFATAFAGHALPQGETPTYAALQGGLASLTAYAATHPDHALALVFATDGGPNECNTNTAQIAQLAADALASPAHIRTFVIGTFGSVDGPIAKPVMDAIAAAGGTTAPYIVTPNTTTTTQFLDALTKVRGAALPCDYAIPAPEAGTADFTKLNVQYTPDTGSAVVYPNRAGAGACDDNGGWYYDVDPATAPPTKAVLCPVTCAAVNAQGGRMDVVLGCQTIVR
jgi:hypothetical protein